MNRWRDRTLALMLHPKFSRGGRDMLGTIVAGTGVMLMLRLGLGW